MLKLLKIKKQVILEKISKTEKVILKGELYNISTQKTRTPAGKQLVPLQKLGFGASMTVKC
jgi:hypothetical protein